MHYCTNTLGKAGKTIFTSFVVIVYIVFYCCIDSSQKMGALTRPKFQLMPDPLDSEPFRQLVVKGEVGGTFTLY